MTIEFEAWPKIPRLKRTVTITEKIDGTNAAVVIGDDGEFAAQSRTRLITPDDDNFGFARWAYERRAELTEILGPGRHFGEWWGQGIQRGYGLSEKRFSLFNTARWTDALVGMNELGLYAVPELITYAFSDELVTSSLANLEREGSQAAPGFMEPEGIVVFMHASRTMHKVTVKEDGKPKSQVPDDLIHQLALARPEAVRRSSGPLPWSRDSFSG